MPATFTSPNNLEGALALKTLLGDKANWLKADEHPWGKGFEALKRRMLPGPDLTDSERVALSDLQLDADLILSTKESWLDHQSRLLSDLLNARELPSIRFELEVLRYACLGAARGVFWERYKPGSHDLRLDGPAVYIECTSLYEFEPDLIFRAIQNKARQRRTDGFPYVIAIGSSGISEAVPRGKLESTMRTKMMDQRWENWFRQHPEVSGALVFNRTPPNRERVERNGVGMRQTSGGSYLDIRSQGALYPLPAEFRFNR